MPPSTRNSSHGRDVLRYLVLMGVLLSLLFANRDIANADDPATVAAVQEFYRHIAAVEDLWQQHSLIDLMAARLAAAGQFESLETLILYTQKATVNTSAVSAAVNELLGSGHDDEARRVLSWQPIVLLPANEKVRLNEVLIPSTVKAGFQSKFGLAPDWCSQAVAGKSYDIPEAELPMSFDVYRVFCVLVAFAERGDTDSLNGFLNRAVAPELHDRAKAIVVFRLVRTGRSTEAGAILDSIRDPLVVECCRTLATKMNPALGTDNWPNFDIRSFCLIYPMETDCQWQNLELCQIEAARGNAVAARRMLLHEHAALCARKPTGRIDVGIFPAGQDARQRAFVAHLAADQQMPKIAISSLEPLRVKAFGFWIDMISETVHLNRAEIPSDLDPVLLCAAAIGQVTPRKTTVPREWSSEFDASHALYSALSGIERLSLTLPENKIPNLGRCRLLLHAAPQSRLKELLHIDHWHDLSRAHKLWVCSMTTGLISNSFIEFELNQRSDPVLICAAMMQIESSSPLFARVENILPMLLLSPNRDIRYFALRWATKHDCQIADELLAGLASDTDIDVRFLALLHQGSTTDEVARAAEDVIRYSENSLLAGEAARWAFEQENLGKSTSGLVERILAQGKQFPILCGVEVWVQNDPDRSKAQAELEKIATSPKSQWLGQQSLQLLSQCTTD